MPAKTRSLNAGSVAFFMEFINKEGPNGCWLWLGATNSFGYGVLNWNGKQNRRAHRVSYGIHTGLLTDDCVLRHSCDNPPCVNPAHLQPGTHADNAHDMFRRGRDWRGARPRGERHGMSKLSAPDVLAIRAGHAAGQEVSVLARQYDIHPRTVRSVVSRRTWQWLEDSGAVHQSLAASAEACTDRRKRENIKTVRICVIVDCGREHYGRQWCAIHYARWREHGDPLAYVRAFGDRAKERTCTVQGCSAKHVAKGYCNMHVKRFRRHGDPLVVIAAKDRAPRRSNATA